MREIKFRAWNIKFKRWDGYNLLEMPENPTNGYEHWTQFTGLKDKNGKEIYEGDIVRYSIEALNCQGENPEFVEYTEDVHFQDGCFELDACPLSIILNGDENIGEVVGNIYQNPDLWTKN